MAARDRLGVAVVGCGYWGPKIIRNLAEMDGAELVMVCDLSEERLQAVRDRCPSATFVTDYRQVLTNPAIDAVVVATPIRTHHRLAMAALLHGKHVLVEKPLTASVNEAEQLVDAAAIAGRILMVGHTFQYNPAVETLRDLVQSSELGRIYYIDCARLNLGLFQRDINVMWDLAPHDISILLHILGALPSAVSAQGAAHVLRGVDDLAHLSLRFPGDINADIRLSWLDPCKVRRITVVGNRKMAVFDDMVEDKVQVYDRSVALRDVAEFGTPTFDYHDGDVVTPDVPVIEPLRAQIAHFLDCIRTGRRPASDGRAGLEVVRILEAADSSRRHDGQWIALDQEAEATPSGQHPVSSGDRAIGTMVS